MSQENNKVAIRRFYDEAINQKKLAVIEELFGMPSRIVCKDFQ
jgi:hypothetical protein